MKKKLLYKILSLILITIVIFGQSLVYVSSSVRAQDSPEEIARQAEEAAREAERDQQKAEEEAKRQAEEAAREAEEAALEALKHATPTPIPPLIIPTAIPTVEPNISSSSDTAKADSGEADNSVENNNSGDVNNNVNTTSNTGNNTISGDQSPSVTPTVIPVTTTDPLPKCEDNLAVSSDNAGEEDNFTQESQQVQSDNPQTDSDSTTSSQQSSTSETEDSDTVTVHNSNCASISNQQDVTATTGDNQAVGNKGTEAQTGSAITDSILVNEGNTNIASGSGETSETTKTEVDNADVENDNQIYAENNVNVESSSGGNTINGNDGQAVLSTGDVDILVNLMNILNMNITGKDFTHLIVNIFGELNGDVDLEKIANNLGMSEHEIKVIARGENHQYTESSEDNSTIDNNNEALVKNNVTVKGETGNNDLSENEDKTQLLTGRIRILVALINFINTNYSGTEWYFAMVNLFGDVSGDIILPDPNQFLVDESNTNIQTDDASIKNEENTSVTNNNQASVSSNLEVTGDSGSNAAYSNEDRVKQDTGKVDVVTNLTNWINVNIAGNNWVLLVVNVFGHWFGKIVGFPGKGTVDAPSSGTLMVAAGGANNSGPLVESGSDDVTIKNKEDTVVTNDNKATVENNVQITGVSGGNTTNNNEDPVAVSTGWIDISADFLNIVNMNVVGKKWMLVLVNIFGNLIGDITFPGAKKNIIPEFTASGEEIIKTAVGNIVENNNTQNSISESIIVTVTPLPEVKIKVITDSFVQPNIEEAKIEVYKAQVPENRIQESVANYKDNEVKILGVSVTVNKNTPQILFLIALVSYLIALRFWAFKKPSE